MLSTRRFDATDRTTNSKPQETTMHSHHIPIPAPAPVSVPDWRPVALIKSFFATLALWHYRWVERRKLEELEDDTLRDVGLSRTAILNEARKPFWQR